MIRISVDFSATAQGGTKVYIDTSYRPHLHKKLKPGMRVILFQENHFEVEADIGHKAGSGGTVYWYGEADWRTVQDIDDHPAYYNRRQYRHALQAIDYYTRGSVPLNSLIGSLWALLNVLKDIPNGWRGYCESECGVLDEIYAGIVTSGRALPNESEQHQVNQAIENIRIHIENVIDEFPPSHDSS